MSDVNLSEFEHFTEKNTANSIIELPTCKTIQNDVKVSQGIRQYFSL